MKEYLQMLRMIDGSFILMYFAIVFFLGSHFITNLAIAQRNDMATQMGIEYDASKVIEANPIAKLWLSVKGVGFVFSYFIMPAMLFAYYFHVRRKDRENAKFIALFFFFMALINVSNDLSVYLGGLF